MGIRRLALAGAVFAAGCALPERDNPHDSNVAPVVRIRVRAGIAGPAIFEGTRADGLHIDLSDSSVGKGEIAGVTIEQVDLRSDDEITIACPRQDPVELTLTEVAPLVFQWDEFGWLCFEDEDPNDLTEEPDRWVQSIGLRVTERSTKGGVGKSTQEFLLANSRPVSVVDATQWVDPAWTTVAVIDNSLHYDADPDDDANRVDHWEFVAGPRTLTLGSNLGLSFELDLADPLDPEPYYGAVYILRVTSCDPWECSEPVLLEVHLERAVWATTTDQFFQLDPAFAPATTLDDGSGLAGVTIAGNASIAPTRDGIRIFTPSSATSRRVRSDLVARPVTLPGVFQELAGSDGFGAVWVAAGPGGSIALYEIGDDDIAVPIAAGFPSSLAGRSYVARHSPGGTRWIGGFDVTYFRFARTTAAGDYSYWDFTNGGPEVACLGDRQIDAAAAAEDGTGWFATELGIVHVSEDGVILSCDELDIGSQNIVTDMEIVSDGDGGEQVIFVEQFDGPYSPFTPNKIRRLVPGTNSSDVVLDGAILGQGIAIDRRTQEIIVVTQNALQRFPPTSFDVPVASVAMSDLFPDIGEPFVQGFQVGLEPTGRTWLLRSDGFAGIRELIRVPPTFSFIRGEFGAATADAPRLPDQSAVDPLTGRLWVAEIEDGLWSAKSFDETGVERALIPLDFAQEQTGSTAVGVASIRIDPGSFNRPAGIWVQDLHQPVPMATPELRVTWIAVADTSLAPVTFGLGQQFVTDGFPSDIYIQFRGVRSAVDPSDGSLWMAIHDTNGADLRLGEFYRLQRDGSYERFATQTATTDNALLETAAIATQFGFFSAGNTDDLVRSRSSAGSTAISICNVGDGAQSTFHDIGAGLGNPTVDGGEIATWCYDDTDAHYVTRAREGAFAIMSLRTPTQNPFAVGVFSGAKPGHLGGVTGVWYMPEGAGLRLYDRYLGDTGLYDMSAQVLYFPR